MSCCAEHHIMSTGSAYVFGMWATSPYLTTFLLGPPLLALLLVYPALLLLTPKEKELDASAYKFTTARDSDDQQPLPKLVQMSLDDDTVQLSIVIPAYNEQERLPYMLKEAIAYIKQLKDEKKTLSGNEAVHGTHHRHHQRAPYHALRAPLESYEILIVDDGSRDSTAKDALAFAKANDLHDVIRLVRLGQNCGKGKAVRHGVLHARGALIAFCDADGATRFNDITNLATELQRILTPAGHGIVCGSRAHLVGSEAVIKRSFVRNFLMHSFHFILSLLMRPPNPVAFVQARLPGFLAEATTGSRASLPTQPPLRDTQCGFKLFTRASAQAVFPLAHIDRWIFDVELLLLAEKASYTTLRQVASLAEAGASAASTADPLLSLPLPISEVAVEWREVEGSKIDILKDSVKMGLDLLVIRLNYALGRWSSPGVLPGVAAAMRNAVADKACEGGHAGASCSR